jgi:hypothetical protein
VAIRCLNANLREFNKTFFNEVYYIKQIIMLQIVITIAMITEWSRNRNYPSTSGSVIFFHLQTFYKVNLFIIIFNWGNEYLKLISLSLVMQKVVESSGFESWNSYLSTLGSQSKEAYMTAEVHSEEPIIFIMVQWCPQSLLKPVSFFVHHSI